MNKLLLSLVASAVLVTTCSIAQPTITAATNTPVAGDVFYNYSATYMPNSGIGTAGAAVTWNFAWMAATRVDTIVGLSCAATPFCADFTGSNFALSANHDTSFLYYQTTPSAFYILADTSTIDSFKDFYSKPRVTWFYPMTYHSSQVDTSMDTYSNMYLGVRNAQTDTIIDSFYCDGYGSLVMPYGTVSNVLRLIDKQISYSAGISFNTYAYYYFTPGVHVPILSVNTDGVDTFLSYMVTGRNTGINNMPQIANDISIYPNPAGDEATLEVPNPVNAYYQVCNNLGQVVMSATIVDEKTNISTTRLAPGLYFVKVTSSGTSVTRKMQKE